MRTTAKSNATRETGQPASSAHDTNSPQRSNLLTTLRRAVLTVICPFRRQMPENAVTPQEAVASFLGTMASTAARTSGLWRQQLELGLADCLTADARKEFFETYPVEDYYFAGVVALEAARIRQVYSPAESGELLAEIGDQIDRAAARGDRVMSDMVFDIVGRIHMAVGPASQKMPYDKVTKALLRSLDIHHIESTRPLMSDKAFRHVLGEPLAIGIQNWWQAFQEKFVLVIPPLPEPEEPEEVYTPPAPARVSPRRRLKRAPSLI